MTDFIFWPLCVLTPQRMRVNLVPFTRSGGMSLGGVEPVTRTDLGHWAVSLEDVVVRRTACERTWNAIRSDASGRAGLFVLQSIASAAQPYASDVFEPVIEVPHGDGAGFDDGTLYGQGAISIRSQGEAKIGATSLKLRVDFGALDVAGARFSYRHAMYEIGRVVSVVGKVVDVKISPSVRATIPAGASLEFDRPSCLCRLADDRGMDGAMLRHNSDLRTINFVEATDYWSSLVA